MKYDETVRLEWRLSGEPWTGVDVWAQVDDEAFAQFTSLSGLVRFGSFTLRMRWFALPSALVRLARDPQNVGSARVHVRGFAFTLTSLREADGRRREAILTCGN